MLFEAKRMIWSLSILAILGVCAAIAGAQEPDAMPRADIEHHQAQWAQQMTNTQLPETDAAGGVDGVKNGGAGFHTNNDGKPPWWQVDLGEPADIGRVVVYNRCDYASDRAKDLILLLSDDGAEWREVYRHADGVFYGVRDNKPLVVKLDGAKGRYLRVALPKPDYLHLDEIEVYGPDDAKANLALNKPATQSSISQWSTHAPLPLSKIPFGPDERERASKIITSALATTGQAGEALQREFEQLAQTRTAPECQAEWVALYARAAQLQSRVQTARSALALVKPEAFTLAVEDLMKTYPEAYAQGSAYPAKAEPFHRRLDEIKAALEKGEESAVRDALALAAIHREALLANPLLNFDSLLLVKRGEGNLGLPANYHGNSDLPSHGYDNEIAVLSPVRGEGEIRTLYRPGASEFVGDVDLDFDAKRLLFSMPAPEGRWQIFEMALDGSAPRQVPLINEPDVNNYDACYLPDGNLIFNSTAPFIGVPCVTGSSHVTNLYLNDRSAGEIRRLTFDQDHDWCPTVLNNGRVLYLRWEYSDLPHYVARILFHMNPDGTGQMEYYGSNSYWPNSMFYARAVPDHPTRFVAIVGGHHDVPRMGELVVFDPEKGRHEADGVVQRIPERGRKVEPVILDGLVGASWPKFLHPYPLSSNYFLVSCKPNPSAPWGLYLVDTFDNMTLIKETPGYALLEPVPLRATPRPPIIPSKVRPESREATVYLTDVYAGGGLEGVPRGEVKALRLFTYQFAYHGMGGQANRVGLDGPWDVKRIIGTVPVEPDGSALFHVPANTPISIQPLDAEGKALQLMRSWMTAMPGETLSCVGCHERQNTTPPARGTLAAQRPPSAIKPWYGPTRGFSFVREVQPVLDAYCVRCHNGAERADGRAIPNFQNRGYVTPEEKTPVGYNTVGEFPPVYLELRPYVRTPSMESDMHMLTPCDFHADASKLVQMLERGHHNVRLDAEAWDRLITWIDLNAPAHGTWREIVGNRITLAQRDRRRALMQRYAGIDEDPEEILALEPYRPRETQVAEAATEAPAQDAPLAPALDPAEAQERQAALGAATRSIDLGDGVALALARIPAGSFYRGDAQGYARAVPTARVAIDNPYWIGAIEVTNAQYRQFDPTHDSRIENGDFLQFSIQERGYPVNEPNQPVVRVSWTEAKAFCDWLSLRTGETFALPSAEEWEYAARAGAATPFWYGEPHADFALYANLADATLHHIDTFGWGLPSGAIPPWRPAVTEVNDKYRVSAPAGAFAANPWGLRDVHGNAAEWTRTDASAGGTKIVLGGSWNDRPDRAYAGFSQAYRTYQKVYDVGFRVVCLSEADASRPNRVAQAR